MSFLVVLKHSYLRSLNYILSWSIPLLLLGVLTLPFYDLVAENEKQIRFFFNEAWIYIWR